GRARGRNAMAIWQDLVSESGFTSGYQSVRRFVGKLRGVQIPQAHPVIVTAPGEEAQVDYGTGPMVRDPQSGKYRRTRLFVLTLGYSRKSVRLLVFQSSSRTWAELHEKAFRRLGGVVRIIVLDNLREGVLVPDVYDPTLNPLYRHMLARCGPCRWNPSAITNTASAPCIWTAVWKSKPPTMARPQDGLGGWSTCSGTTSSCACSIRAPVNCCASMSARNAAAIASSRRITPSGRRSAPCSCWREPNAPALTSAPSARPSIAPKENWEYAAFWGCWPWPRSSDWRRSRKPAPPRSNCKCTNIALCAAIWNGIRKLP